MFLARSGVVVICICTHYNDDFLYIYVFSTTFYLQNAISLDFQQFQNAIYKREEFSFLNTIKVIYLDHITTAGGLSFRVNHLLFSI